MEPTTGRLATATATVANNLSTAYDALTLGYTYDAAGNPTLVKDTTKAGSEQTVTPIVKQFCYGYDPAQRLQRAATGAAGDNQCTNPNSAPTDTTNTTFDPNYDLTYGFTGDRLTGVTENIPSAVGSSVITVNYQNTNAGTAANPGAPHQTTATATTAPSDVVQAIVQDPNLGWPRELPSRGTLAYDTNGRIQQWTPSTPLPSSVHPDGGIGATGFIYAYDHQGRLTKTTPTSTLLATQNAVANSYNADGTRFMRQNSVAQVAQGQTIYLADGTEINTNLTGLYSTRRFTTPAGTPVASIQGGNPNNPRWTVLFADAQDTVRLRAAHDPGATSSDVEWLNYYPYGDYTEEGVLAATPNTDDDHGYLNKDRDLNQDIRLDQRFYTPAFNQLTTPDPIFTPGDPLSANPYSYSRNNPISQSDPSGLKPACVEFGTCPGGYLATQPSDSSQGRGFSPTPNGNGTWAWTPESPLFRPGFTFKNVAGGLVDGIVRPLSVISDQISPECALLGWCNTSALNGLEDWAGVDRNSGGFDTGTSLDTLFSLLALGPVSEVEPLGGSLLESLALTKAASAAKTGALAETQVGTTMDDLLQGATFLKQAKATQYVKPGGFIQANADFDALAQGVTVIQRGGGLRTATLSNGTKINVRPFSSGKVVTLEVDTPGNPVLKIRYVP